MLLLLLLLACATRDWVRNVGNCEKVVVNVDCATSLPPPSHPPHPLLVLSCVYACVGWGGQEKREANRAALLADMAGSPALMDALHASGLVELENMALEQRSLVQEGMLKVGQSGWQETLPSRS